MSASRKASRGAARGGRWTAFSRRVAGRARGAVRSWPWWLQLLDAGRWKLDAGRWALLRRAGHLGDAGAARWRRAEESQLGWAVRARPRTGSGLADPPSASIHFATRNTHTHTRGTDGRTCATQPRCSSVALSSQRAPIMTDCGCDLRLVLGLLARPSAFARRVEPLPAGAVTRTRRYGNGLQHSQLSPTYSPPSSLAARTAPATRTPASAAPAAARRDTPRP